MSISAPTLVAVVSDIAESLQAAGVDRLAIVNGHGGNYVLANVVQQANTAGPRMTLFPSRTDWEAARTAAGLESTISEDMHAGELEVSLLLHGHPELVDDGYRRGDWEAADRPHLLVTGMRGYTETGVMAARRSPRPTRDVRSWRALHGPSRITLPCFPKMPTRDNTDMDAMRLSHIGKVLLGLLVRSFSTTSRPALRAASGRPPARQRHGRNREPAHPPVRQSRSSPGEIPSRT